MRLVDKNFVIEDRHGRDLVILRFYGLWDGDTVRSFIAALEAAGVRRGRAGLGSLRARTLIDVRRHGVQTREVAAMLERFLERRAEPRRRIAMLTDGSQLQKMQIRRVAATARYEFFTDETEALRWLGGAAPAGCGEPAIARLR